MSSNLQLISVRLPEWMIEAMDRLVALGFFTHRSEIIREAIRELLKRYLQILNAATIQMEESESSAVST